MTGFIGCEYQSQLLGCTGGFAFGYGISKLAGLPEKAARTNSIEVILCQALPQSAVEWQMQGLLFAWSHLVLQQCSPTPITMTIKASTSLGLKIINKNDDNFNAFWFMMSWSPAGQVLSHTQLDADMFWCCCRLACKTVLWVQCLLPCTSQIH